MTVRRRKEKANQGERRAKEMSIQEKNKNNVEFRQSDSHENTKQKQVWVDEGSGEQW